MADIELEEGKSFGRVPRLALAEMQRETGSKLAGSRSVELLGNACRPELLCSGIPTWDPFPLKGASAREQETPALAGVSYQASISLSSVCVAS
jgi:hypothetical protein